MVGNWLVSRVAMHTVDAIHTRRSIRSYQPRPVDRSVIEEILWDAAQAPTPPASGDTPFTFVVIDGADRVALYGSQALELALAARLPGSGNDWLDLDEFSVFFNAPAIIVICAEPDERGEAEQNCSRAGQNLMLSAEARGLGTCWVDAALPWLREPQTRAELGIPETLTPFAAFTLGHPQGMPAGKPRERPPIIWTP
jgi:nitroreductase